MLWTAPRVSEIVGFLSGQSNFQPIAKHVFLTPPLCSPSADPHKFVDLTSFRKLQHMVSAFSRVQSKIKNTVYIYVPKEFTVFKNTHLKWRGRRFFIDHWIGL